MLMERLGLYACQADTLTIPAEWDKFHLPDGYEKCQIVYWLPVQAKALFIMNISLPVKAYRIF